MAADPAIPTIDMAPLRIGSEAEKREVAHRIDAACRNTGFFLVTGHGVSADLITKARQRAIDFFALPLDDKMRCSDRRRRSVAAIIGSVTVQLPIRWDR
jgi:isopenicillin N synthase-like dioxygenase